MRATQPVMKKAKKRVGKISVLREPSRRRPQ